MPQAGMDDYIAKPVRLAELVAMFQKHTVLQAAAERGLAIGEPA
jgi:DNA-binding response OmpR family regulator